MLSLLLCKRKQGHLVNFFVEKWYCQTDDTGSFAKRSVPDGEKPPPYEGGGWGRFTPRHPPLSNRVYKITLQPMRLADIRKEHFFGPNFW